MKKLSKKKKYFLLAGVGLLGLLIGLGLVFGKNIYRRLRPGDEGAKEGVLAEKTEEKEEFNFDWALWEDPAGFSFQYPRQLEVDVHPEDEVYYSHLELTDAERSGLIVILCNDTEYTKISDWAEGDELARMGSSLETEIASMPARKVALGNGRELAGLIDRDLVLYTLDKQPEEEESFWQAVYNKLIQSFRLIPLEGESEEAFNQWLGDFDTSGVDIVAPVEVIE